MRRVLKTYLTQEEYNAVQASARRAGFPGGSDGAKETA